jgi:hypothetical protein
MNAANRTGINKGVYSKGSRNLGDEQKLAISRNDDSCLKILVTLVHVRGLRY